MGKSCWMARLALQQHFPTQLLLVFLSIKIATKFYIPMLQTSNLAVGTWHEVLDMKFKGGRSREP